MLDASAVANLEASISGPAVEAAGPRGRLAAALGLAACGRRATAFLSGPDLAACLDLLAQAVRRRLPVVVHHDASAGHEACHAAAAAGAAVLFAADVQEAVDLTLLARRLAEDALVPVVVAMDGPETAPPARDLQLPPPEATRRFLGRPDEVMHPPTPSQERLFGQHRRRLPRWYDPERPLLHGAGLGPEAFAPAAASRRVFFDAHLPELLERASEAFRQEIGRPLEALRTEGVKGAKFLVLGEGAAVPTAEAAAATLRGAGLRVGVVGLRVLSPWPAASLGELLRGRRGVVVLERAEEPLLSPRLGRDPSLRLTSAIYGLGGSRLRAADLAALLRELAGRGAERRSLVYLGFDMTAAGAYPKRQALRDGLARDYPGIARLGVRGEAAPELPPGDALEAARRPSAESLPPPAVRRMGKSSAPLADLPGFWGRVGVLYRDAAAPELMPDPFLATATVPPLSSALRDVSPARSVLPAFDPALCTGCGACWTACPDSAVGPVVIAPSALFEHGMKKASSRGHSVDKLRMVLSKVASRAGKEMAGREGGPAGPLFDDAFAAVVAAMKLPDEREAGLREAYQAVRAEIADLPVTRTAAFFAEGGGELFSLTLDPDACKGCGLCVAECEPGALTAVDDDPRRTDRARRLWHLGEELPPPSAAAVERARGHPDVGPLAAALLSRGAREVMAGGHGAEPGSGETLALRQILGAAAYRLGPVLRGRSAQVEELAAKLAEAIHQSLAHALPGRDLDALAQGLEALHKPDADLAELTARVETAFEDERVDVDRTRRLVAAARAVADLKWRLETGEGGLGRAPFGLVLAVPEMAWAAAFPHNPFRVPVTVDATGEAVAMARGLAEGRLREAVETVRVLRRARLELDGSTPRAFEELDRLAWRDLSADERRWCEPVFLATSEKALAGGGVPLLPSPLKILVLSDSAAEGSDSVNLLGAEAFFARPSVADPDALERAVAAALDHDGPALLRVVAPSPLRGGFAADATLREARERVAGQAAAALEAVDGESAGAAGPPAEDAVTALKERHAAEIAALTRDYEARLAAQRAGFQAETAQRVRARLMRLALARPPGSDSRRTSP